MRKSIVALATAATIAVAGIPAASAQTSSEVKQSSTETVTEVSSQLETSSIGENLQGQWEWATEGFDMMSSGSPLEGAGRILGDWVLGSVAVTAIGSLIVLISNALSNF